MSEMFDLLERHLKNAFVERDLGLLLDGVCSSRLVGVGDIADVAPVSVFHPRPCHIHRQSERSIFSSWFTGHLFPKVCVLRAVRNSRPRQIIFPFPASFCQISSISTLLAFSTEAPLPALLPHCLPGDQAPILTVCRGKRIG